MNFIGMSMNRNRCVIIFCLAACVPGGATEETPPRHCWVLPKEACPEEPPELVNDIGQRCPILDIAEVARWEGVQFGL